MLRITEVESDGTGMVRLEGQMIGRWVAEARRVCQSRLQANQKLIVDVGEVSFADVTGTALLCELADRGALLTNLSPFLAQQVKEARGRMADTLDDLRG
jgi:ABC-type transporter Mla MlaB component